MDALARVGEGIVSEVGGSDSKDPSRKNKKLPRQLAAVVALRAQGYDNREIAEKIGETTQKVTRLIMKARKEYGWSDLHEQLVHRAVPQAMENVIRHLDHEGSEAGIKQGMSTMTRATVAGVGIFKSHSAAKVEQKSESTNVLRVEVVLPQLPPGVQALALSEGSVLATPRRALPAPDSTPVAPILDGEVVKQ
jgi:predicted transcriptional regulator